MKTFCKWNSFLIYKRSELAFSAVRALVPRKKTITQYPREKKTKTESEKKTIIKRKIESKWRKRKWKYTERAAELQQMKNNNSSFFNCIFHFILLFFFSSFIFIKWLHFMLSSSSPLFFPYIFGFFYSIAIQWFPCIFDNNIFVLSFVEN